MQVKPSQYKLKNSINNISQLKSNINKVKTINKQTYDPIE
ncbi:hypothetical protein AAKU67_004358 [Oxalobacteraceae bacterium GrIS 2.11]